MQTYRIIGADGKEYGPVSDDQIRRWIAEGRANHQTQAQAAGNPDWQPLSAFPEFAAALGTTASPVTAGPPGPSGGAASPDEILSRDYALDIASCFTRSWATVKENFWPVVGVTLLVSLVIGGIGQALGLISGPAMRAMFLGHFSVGGVSLVLLTSLISAPVSSVLLGGLFRYYLKLIRGETATVGDAFSGLSVGFVPLVLFGFIQCFFVYLGLLLCIVPGIYLSVAWYFAIPLISDRGMDFWPAMELSRKVVSKHWFLVFGFLLVMGLLAASGVVACCVGIVVTVPIGLVAVMYAYEDIFGQH